jgi:hypothetical protein
MKRLKLQIDRLFEAARKAPARADEPMPAYLPTRVFARLQAEQRPNEILLAWGRALKVGLGLAVAIMLACVAWNYSDLSLQPENFQELATVRANLDSDL